MGQSTPYTRGTESLGGAPSDGIRATQAAAGDTATPFGASADESSGTAPNPLRTLGMHLSTLAHETMTLVRQELALAKAEMREKGAEVGKGLGEIATAGGIALAGLVILLGAAVAALAEIWPVWLAALVVGGAALLVGFMLANRARAHLETRKLRPSETIAAARNSGRSFKEGLR